jgi:hypothetical protein
MQVRAQVTDVRRLNSDVVKPLTALQKGLDLLALEQSGGTSGQQGQNLAQNGLHGAGRG